jgi:hypothetical protein
LIVFTKRVVEPEEIIQASGMNPRWSGLGLTPPLTDVALDLSLSMVLLFPLDASDIPWRTFGVFATVVQTPDPFVAARVYDAPGVHLIILNIADNDRGVREKAVRRTNALKDGIEDAILV